MSQFIRYAGDDYLTADAVADAVIEYAVALADLGLMGVAELPVWADDGSISSVRLVVGRDMPIATASTPETAPGIDVHPEAGSSASRIRGTATSLRTRGTAYSVEVDRPASWYSAFSNLDVL